MEGLEKITVLIGNGKVVYRSAADKITAPHLFQGKEHHVVHPSARSPQCPMPAAVQSPLFGDARIPNKYLIS